MRVWGRTVPVRGTERALLAVVLAVRSTSCMLNYFAYGIVVFVVRDIGVYRVALAQSRPLTGSRVKKVSTKCRLRVDHVYSGTLSGTLILVPFSCHKTGTSSTSMERLQTGSLSNTHIVNSSCTDSTRQEVMRYTSYSTFATPNVSIRGFCTRFGHFATPTGSYDMADLTLSRWSLIGHIYYCTRCITTSTSDTPPTRIGKASCLKPFHTGTRCSSFVTREWHEN